MLNIFSRLAAAEEMPAREKTRELRRRPVAYRGLRSRQRPSRGIALPQARRRYPRLGQQQVMLLLWVLISAALLAVALALNSTGHEACIQPAATACPSTPSHNMPTRPAYR